MLVEGDKFLGGKKQGRGSKQVSGRWGRGVTWLPGSKRIPLAAERALADGEDVGYERERAVEE